ncbi:hypothetical protein AAEU28_16170 [Pseudoalteromonas sp. SS15]|uniref:flagellin N-terminal helical domain-containing protein n=1 Tax=Pseudoalteromonas sp. SS15 TaxID=3139393 RepID=UPI003BAB9BFE
MKISSPNTINANRLESGFEKLASGKKLNSAKDDAAAIQILTSVIAEQSGSTVAIRNANDGVSFAQVAGGALQSVTDNLNRVEALAIQANSGALSASDRSAIQSEVEQLQAGIAQTIESTNFAGKPVFSGESTQFQVSPNQGETQSLSVDVSQVLEQLSNLDVSSQLKAGQSLELAKELREGVSDQQSDLASFSNSIYQSINTNRETQLASTAGRERIESTDYALESAKGVASQLKLDVDIALRAQSNALPNGIDKLLS